MNNRNLKAAFGLMAIAVFIPACSSANEDPDNISINLSSEVSGPNCRPVAQYSIGSDHPLRLVNYTITMTGPGDGDRTKIESGVVLMPSGDVKRDRSISLHNHEAACAEMAITWTDVICEGEDRQPMACPPIVLIGGDEFKSVEVVQPVAQ